MFHFRQSYSFTTTPRTETDLKKGHEQHNPGGSCPVGVENTEGTLVKDTPCSRRHVRKVREIHCSLPALLLTFVGGTIAAPILELTHSLFIRPVKTLKLVSKDGCSLANCGRVLATVLLAPVDLVAGLAWGITTGGIRICMDIARPGNICSDEAYFNGMGAPSLVANIQDHWTHQIERRLERAACRN